LPQDPQGQAASAGHQEGKVVKSRAKRFLEAVTAERKNSARHLNIKRPSLAELWRRTKKKGR
jgi:hypothetical protein